MSLVSFIGPRPNIFDLEGTSRRKRLEVRQPILTNERSREDPLASAMSRTVSTPRRSTSPIRPSEGAAGMRRRARPAVRPRRGGGRTAATTSSSCPTGWSARTASPIPALLATAAVHHHLIRKGLRTSVGLVVEIRRAARGASFLLPRRLRRRGDQPLSRLRDAARHARARRAAGGGRRQRGRLALHQVDRQGHPQGDVQDGHLDLPVLLRRADLRRRRPVDAISSTATSSAPRRRSRASAWPRSPRRRCAATATPSATIPVLPQRARRRRRICLPHARRGPCLDARYGARPAARRARQGSSDNVSRNIATLINERGRARAQTIRGLFQHQDRRGDGRAAGAARRGRAGGRHRQALLDRRHVLRLDLARGAHHARHRHEPRSAASRTPARAARRRTASGRCRTAIRCARRSSRSPRAASA